MASIRALISTVLIAPLLRRIGGRVVIEDAVIIEAVVMRALPFVMFGDSAHPIGVHPRHSDVTRVTFSAVKVVHHRRRRRQPNLPPPQRDGHPPHPAAKPGPNGRGQTRAHDHGNSPATPMR